MCKAGQGTRGPATTARAPFLRLCNACGREQRNGYYECEIHFSTQFTKGANDKAGIQAADVILGLRRVPAGFYAVVHHGGLEWRTENKRLSVNSDVIEWGGPIPL